MPYDRDIFFDSVRDSLFEGKLTQRQVDAMNYLLDVWEKGFDDRKEWLAYALATAFHETAFLMCPIEEYGKGEGKSYGEPAGPHGKCYYGRGHVQLTWHENYVKAENILKDTYSLTVPLEQYPERMLEDEPSAIVLYDGMIEGWFTGVGLPQFFDDMIEDPVNARKVVNGLDHAEVIAEHYDCFKRALVEVEGG
jgi:putative chitinase